MMNQNLLFWMVLFIATIFSWEMFKSMCKSIESLRIKMREHKEVRKLLNK